MLQKFDELNTNHSKRVQALNGEISQKIDQLTQSQSAQNDEFTKKMDDIVIDMEDLEAQIIERIDKTDNDIIKQNDKIDKKISKDIVKQIETLDKKFTDKTEDLNSFIQSVKSDMGYDNEHTLRPLTDEIKALKKVFEKMNDLDDKISYWQDFTKKPTMRKVGVTYINTNQPIRLYLSAPHIDIKLYINDAEITPNAKSDHFTYFLTDIHCGALYRVESKSQEFISWSEYRKKPPLDFYFMYFFDKKRKKVYGVSTEDKLSYIFDEQEIEALEDIMNESDVPKYLEKCK